MHLAFGSDHAGFTLKSTLLAHAADAGHTCEDLGCFDTASVDYPDYAHLVAEAVLSGKADRGILVCGTGIGISMAANRHAGIRAARVTDTLSARLSRQHNDANVLCLGERITGVDLAKDILDAWLAEPFAGDRHVKRVAKIELSETNGV